MISTSRGGEQQALAIKGQGFGVGPCRKAYGLSGGQQAFAARNLGDQQGIDALNAQVNDQRIAQLFNQLHSSRNTFTGQAHAHMLRAYADPLCIGVLPQGQTLPQFDVGGRRSGRFQDVFRNSSLYKNSI